MHTDSSTSKTDGICAFASFYMSLCCRSELFLNSGELNPCCPDCQRPTEWIIVLRGSSGIVAQTRRAELRRTSRYTLPKEGLCVVCVEWNFSRVEDVRVLNVSQTGMAIALPAPPQIRSEVKLLSEERHFVQVGQVRHCSCINDVYVTGIEFSRLHRRLDPTLWVPKDDAARRVRSGAEVNRFKAVLTTKQAELLSGPRNREEIAIDTTADLLDEVQLWGERELAIRDLDRESKLLRSVRSALARIEDGCFGTCLCCEEAISPKRLQAVPWAAYCLQCQEVADDHENLGRATDLSQGHP